MNLGQVQTGPSYKRILLIFLLIALIIAVISLYFIVAKAKITITPKQSTKTVEFSFTVDANENIVDESLATIPGQFIEKQINQTVTVENLPTKQLDDYASGQVTFSNKTNQPRALIKNTQLITDSGLVFRTQNPVTIQPGEQETVEVKSDEKGEEYNIGPSHFTVKLLSWLKESLYADNSEPMTGGIGDVKIIDETSLPDLVEKAKNELKQEIFNDLEQEVEADFLLSDDSVTFSIDSYSPIDPQIYLEDSTLKIKLQSNEEKENGYLIRDEFKIQLKCKALAFAYKQTDIDQLALTQAQKALEEKYEFLGLATTLDLLEENPDSETTVEEGIKVIFDQAFPEKQKATLKAEVQAKVIHKLGDKAFDKGALAGFTKGDLVDYYNRLDVAEDVQVEFWPFWVRNVPANGKRVEIEVRSK